MAITVVSTVVLSYIQYRLYSNNFETVFSNLEESVLTMKRDSARDILREVKIATEGSSARGEYDVFTNFAKKQKEIGEIQAFSFYGRAGKVEPPSDSGRINQSLAAELRTKRKRQAEMFLTEDTGAFSFYYPLHMSTRLRHLAASTRPGTSASCTACSASSSPKTKSIRCPSPLQRLYGGLVASQLRRDLCRGRGIVPRFGVALLICRAILRPLRACMDAVKGLTGEDFSERGEEPATTKSRK